MLPNGSQSESKSGFIVYSFVENKDCSDTDVTKILNNGRYKI